MFTWPAAPVTTTVIGLVMLSVMSETYEQPLKKLQLLSNVMASTKVFRKGGIHE